MKRKRGRPWMRNPELVAAILADIEAGDSVRTAVLANGISDETWRLWCVADPELLGRSHIAMAKGNQRLRREALQTTDKTVAHVRLHLLGCRDAAWSARQRVEHSISTETIADLMAREVDAPS